MTGEGSSDRGRGRLRLLFHVVLSTIAWCGFIWAWYVVFLKRTADQTLTGLLVLGGFLVFMLLATLLWVRHNLAVYKRKGPRRAVPTVRESWSHDALGRPLESDWSRVRSAPLVVVEVGSEAKRYVPDASPQGAGSS